MVIKQLALDAMCDRMGPILVYPKQPTDSLFELRDILFLHPSPNTHYRFCLLAYTIETGRIFRAVDSDCFSDFELLDVI